MVKRAIRFEDLGEPVQRLLKSLKGGYTEEDIALLKYVSVKGMAKIYGELSSDRHAEEIWEELRASLQDRREKAERRELDLLSREQQLVAERAQQEAEEAEEKQGRAEKKQRCCEAQEREESLEVERAKQRAQESGTQKEAWEEYVAEHPLEFGEGAQKIEQKRVEHKLKSPPVAGIEVLNRTYTPKCPNCSTKFMHPPKEWECPFCLKRTHQHIKVWQPDNSSSQCMICNDGIGRFTRHHCRSCGRLVCDACSTAKGIIAALGFSTPAKICDDCVRLGHRHV